MKNHANEKSTAKPGNIQLMNVDLSQGLNEFPLSIEHSSVTEIDHFELPSFKETIDLMFYELFKDEANSHKISWVLRTVASLAISEPEALQQLFREWGILSDSEDEIIFPKDHGEENS